MPGPKRMIAFLVASMPLATAALAQTTVTLQQGASYSGAADDWIICCSGADTNKGADVEVDMRSTSDYGLFRFSIFQSEGGPVPNGATITSATLSLYKSFGPDAVFKASRLLKPWTEMGATWNSTGAAPWTTPGAQGAGTDVLASADGQGSAPDSAANNCADGVGHEICWLNIDVTAGVQAFANGSAQNFGWLLQQVSSSGEFTYKDFISKDATTFSQYRPKLTVNYAGAGCGAVPVASFTATPASGPAPLAVTFDASGSSDGGSPITSLTLQFGDATQVTWGSKTQTQAHSYGSNGTFTATLTAANACGTSAPVSRQITVGNNPPGDIVPSEPAAGDLAFAVPTFHSMGLYYSTQTTEPQVWMRYRKSTDTAWRTGYPLWVDPRTTDGNSPATNTLPFTAPGPVTGATLQYRARGSAVMLDPGTRYYFEFGTGPQSAITWLHYVAGTTWQSTFPEDPAVTTIPSQNDVYVIPATGGGNPGAYKVYDGWNGTSKNVVNRLGQNLTADPGVDAAHAIVVKASFVIIRRVRATGAALAGIYVAPNVTDVVIEDSQVDDWSWQPGTTSGEPNPNSWGTWGQNEIGGIHLAQNNSRIVIQRNVIKAPHFGSFPWDTSSACDPTVPSVPQNHPIGPDGIAFETAGQQNVVRYNEITGDAANRNHWYMDGVGGGDNFSPHGSPGADSDIYQNIIMNVFDDAIEAEGGGRNVRIWGNYLSETKSAVATTTVHFGPTYIWRNVVNHVRTCYQQVADGNPAGDWPTNAFKMGGWDSVRAGEGYGNGIRYLFHNTVLQSPGAFGAEVVIEPTSNGSGSVAWTIAHNNILETRDETNLGWSIQTGDTPTGSNFDANMCNGRVDTAIPQPAAPYTFTASQLFYEPGDGAQSVPALGGGGVGNYRLGAGSVGIDVGQVLPNFSDGFIGGAPDEGAQESGSAGPMKFGITAGQ
ncbi:MAG TPA: DNRLRE domain-containing protein [Myxococcales bacterium]|nr:DNRLRE domain-containing protein [Myxococcales bacterium]